MVRNVGIHIFLFSLTFISLPHDCYMANAARQTLIIWISLLILSGLIFFLLRTPQIRQWMWQQTGEEAFGAQVKGLSDLASDLLRPPLRLESETELQQSVASPFRSGTRLLPSNATPRGSSAPHNSAIVGNTSMCAASCDTSLPPPIPPSGHRTKNGTRCPPSYSDPF